MKYEGFLLPEELSERWGGSPTPDTLKNWAVQGVGPTRHSKVPGSGPNGLKLRRSYYKLTEVQEYEQKCTS